MSGERARTRTIVIASGARYRRPDITNLAAFEAAHVHYWASPAETRLCAATRGCAHRRRQFGRPGGCLSGEYRVQGLAPCARQEPGGHHVELPHRPHRGAGQHRGLDRDRGKRPRRRRRRAEGRLLAATRLESGNPGAPSVISSSSSAQTLTPIGCDPSKWPWTPKVSCKRAKGTPASAHWRRTGAASSPSATSAPARSSGSPRPSGDGAQVVVAIRARLAEIREQARETDKAS